MAKTRSKVLFALWIPVAGTWACGGTLTQARSPLPQFKVSPDNVFLVVGSSLQFQASSAGAPVPVTWQVDEADAGTITAAGLFTSKICTSVSTAHVRAVLKTDATQSAVAQVTFGEHPMPFIYIAAITQTATGTPAHIDSLAGALEVHVQLTVAGVTCQPVVAARLQLLAGSTVFPLDSIAFSPPLTGSRAHTFHWNSATLANGPYSLQAAAQKLDGSTIATPAVPVQLRNP
jgi:hypothetical protein